MRQSIWAWGMGFLVAALAVVQLVPVSRANPPRRDVAPLTAEVSAVLRRACYDCHSNETRWPWYSRVAPVSWAVAHDVTRARVRFNLSEWHAYDAAQRRTYMRALVHHLAKDDMPPWFYKWLHPEARLSERDRSILRDWAIGVARGPVARTP